MQYRIQQSWSAFHRLYRFLVSKSLPIADRPRLWRTCVQTALFYGLPAIQLDAHCCSALRTHVIKQLRSIARSPAHITHESNDAIRHRLRVTDVIEQITSATQARLAKARQHLAELQPLNVQQYWGTLEADGVSRSLKQHASVQSVTEVTQVFRQATPCPVCGNYFPSLHGVRTHLGKAHAETSTAYTQNSSQRNQLGKINIYDLCPRRPPSVPLPLQEIFQLESFLRASSAACMSCSLWNRHGVRRRAISTGRYRLCLWGVRAGSR